MVNKLVKNMKEFNRRLTFTIKQQSLDGIKVECFLTRQYNLIIYFACT